MVCCEVLSVLCELGRGLYVLCGCVLQVPGAGAAAALPGRTTRHLEESAGHLGLYIWCMVVCCRYQVLVQPLRSLAGRPLIWRKVLAAWVFAFVFAIPQLLIFVQTDEGG